MLDIGIPYPGDLPAPEGFEKLPWDHALVGEEAYLQCLDLELPPPATRAQGPYVVLARHQLRSADGLRLQEHGERLLRRIT